MVGQTSSLTDPEVTKPEIVMANISAFRCCLCKPYHKCHSASHHKRKLKWYVHILRANNLSTAILHDSRLSKRRRGRQQKKKCSEDVTKWIGTSFTLTLACNKDVQRKLIRCLVATTLAHRTDNNKASIYKKMVYLLGVAMGENIIC